MALDKSKLGYEIGPIFYDGKSLGQVIDFLDYEKIEKVVSSWKKLEVPVLELVQWFLAENIRFVLTGEEISVTSHNGSTHYAIFLKRQMERFEVVKYNEIVREGIFTDNLLETLKTLDLDRY